MNKLQRVFGKPRLFFPVIHAIDHAQVREQVDIAREAKADGVFIINQGGMTGDDVVQLAGELAAEHSGWFVGVNLLGHSLPYALEVLSRVRPMIRGLWRDAADLERWSSRTERWNVPSRPSGDETGRLYFGGVAFKGQAEVPAVRWGIVASDAADAGVDVVTTSGPRTGFPPSTAKVKSMRAALGDHALALASGITINNIRSFLPYADAFLVGTGIEQNFGFLDSVRTAELAAMIHSWQPAVGSAHANLDGKEGQVADLTTPDLLNADREAAAEYLRSWGSTPCSDVADDIRLGRHRYSGPPATEGEVDATLNTPKGHRGR